MNNSASHFVLQIVMMYIAVVIFGFVLTPVFPETDCRFSVNRKTTKSYPVLLQPNFAEEHVLNSSFIYPDNAGFVRVKYNNRMVVLCAKSTIAIRNDLQEYKSAIAKCVNSETFFLSHNVKDATDSDNEYVKANMSDLSCQRYDGREARRTEKKCFNRHSIIDLGIMVETTSSKPKFIKLVEICYDFDHERALYSSFELTKNILGGQQKSERPHFSSATKGFSSKYKRMYKRENQRGNINGLVGLQKNSSKYISETGSYYLARGHLTPRANFVYAVQQQATFYYENTAPQWQTFNGGNWNILERAVRSYASAKGVDLRVYTGTHGVMTLPRENSTDSPPLADKDVQIYLSYDSLKVPVPEIFWKVVYDADNKAGVAFVGVNNPYRNVTSTICADICDDLKWIRWKNRQDIVQGYCYCCSVANFRETVKTLPSLQVTKLLGE